MNEKIVSLINNIEKVIVGKRDVIIRVITAMLSGGHVLIEDVPGVGKTQLVSALAKSVGGKYNRIQLTPDIMPSDIVGFSMIDRDTHELIYKEGAAMCNFLLADEINRASPKSQSALLEVMEEHQISIDGRTMKLPEPFMTLATQNPVETYGTYHLPEAQMDRFIMKISIGYPSAEQELEIVSHSEKGMTSAAISAVMDVSDITELIRQAGEIYVADTVRQYAVAIVNATRNSPLIRLGVSPRGSIALVKSAKSFAFVNGRDYVTPDDIRTLASDCLAHRIILSPKGRSEYATSEQAMAAVLMTVPAPTK
ncbi:MAG: MoxR family ATPase [Ruminococcus sp.]|nr:MoxR family ATPase [Ruminococcus sp.]